MSVFRRARAVLSAHRRTAILVTICSCVAPLGAARPGVGAQSLAGTTLRPVDNMDSLISDLLGRFGGSGPRDTKPAIGRVVVKEDGPRRLSVVVSYSGLPDAMLSGDVRGRDRRAEVQVQAPAVSLGAAAGEATLVFELPRGTTGAIESAYLRVMAANAARPSSPILTRTYALGKKWLTAGATTTVRIAPVPIGTAARLGSRPDYAPPPNVVVPIKAMTPTGAMVAQGRYRSGAVEVRDHRTTAPEVRDHRTGRGGASPVMTAQRRETAVRTAPATAMLPSKAAVMQMERFHYGVRPEDAQKGAQGPDAAPIELLEGLRTDDIEINPAQLLSMSSSLHPDKNRASGIFYYYPRAFHLEWTPDGGHGMRILYGAATGAGASGDVMMAVRLESGLDLSEVQLATELLRAYTRRNPSTPFTALRPLPLEKDGLDVSLGSALGQYSVPKEKIAITGLSDVLGEIEVSWITDPVTKENMQLALTQDVGVNGTVEFTVAGGALATQIPIAIQLADRASYGRGRWNRTEGYRNLTPYPERLRYLHALVVDPRTNLPILYSWSLGNTEVPPQARVEWDPAAVPAWIDTEAKRIWVDYTMVASCEPCDKQVLDAITGGVTSIAADQITFHTITPLADVGGYELTAQVRSNYFDPKDRAELQKSVVLKADNQDFVVKPIYNGDVPAGQPLFEYRLELAMPDGRLYRGTRWIGSDALRVLIGKSQLEQSLGTLPEKRP